MNRTFFVAALLASSVSTQPSWRLGAPNGAAVGHGVGQLAWAETDEPRTRDELEAEQRRVEHHLLRVQQERFEAQARDEPEKTLRRLDREFSRTQKRRIEVIRDLQAAEE
jgi:hypothetical protein